MIERYISAMAIEAPGREEPAATRERLRAIFPPGATRRMTQLGMLLGSVLNPIGPGEEDAIVYASTYAENRALEAYLASFPAASPMLFQTSIHPSAVQQVLIARQQPVRHFYPLTGRGQIAAHAAQTALLDPGARSILCGGEERGPWLLDHGVGSPESFAFAVALSGGSAGALGSLGLEAINACRMATCHAARFLRGAARSPPSTAGGRAPGSP